MKAFRFQLQSVLNLREQAEKAAQEQCARANAALERAKARLRAAEEALVGAQEVQCRELSAGVRADRLGQLRAYVAALAENCTRMRRELAEAQAAVAAAAHRLVLATQRREVLERLRDSKRKVYDYHVAQLEQKLLDDSNGRTPDLLAASSLREVH